MWLPFTPPPSCLSLLYMFCMPQMRVSAPPVRVSNLIPSPWTPGSLPCLPPLCHPSQISCTYHYGVLATITTPSKVPTQSTDLPNPSPNLQARGNTNLGHLAPMELQLGVAQLLSLTRWTHLTVLIAQHGPGALAAPQTPAQ